MGGRVVLASAACGLASVTGCGAGVDAPPRVGGIESPAVLPASLGACSESGHVDGPNAFDFVSQPGAWLRVDSFDLASGGDPTFETTQTYSGRFTVLGGDKAVVDALGSTVDSLVMHGSTAKSANEALLVNAAVYMHSGFEGDARDVDFALAIKGRDFAFLGDCAGKMLTSPIGKRLGPDAVDLLQQEVIGQPSVVVSNVLRRGVANVPSPEPGQIILNPEFSSKELLDSLGLAFAHLHPVPDSWIGGAYTICTHIKQGWSDCIDLSSRESADISVGMYFDPTSPDVEVWLLNGHASFSSPIGMLGVVDLRALAEREKLSLGGDFQLEIGLADAVSPDDIATRRSDPVKGIVSLGLVPL